MENKNTALSSALLRIFGYVLAMSLFENFLEGSCGQLGRALTAGAVLLLLTLDMRRRKLRFSQVALSQLPYRELLYLLPLALIATANLWHGAALRYSVGDTLWRVVAMLLIGSTEELLFRGYLLQALKAESVKKAILISSLTFGLGHIVNLANGAELLPTLLQLLYAFAIGLLLSVLMVQAKNILPCCVFHGVFNALSAFSKGAALPIASQLLDCAVIVALSLSYALYLWKKWPQRSWSQS